MVGIATLGWLGAPALLTGLETPGNAYGLALTYIRLMFVSMPFMMVSVILTMGLRGTGDAKTPLRVTREYVPNQMTSNDPRISLVPTGLPPGVIGRLFACVVSPEEVTLALQREGQEPLVATVNLA